ncbi:MAG: 50S ribosomal protein L30 [Spirochaetales bacterium]|nr:50S ribosomal protein L30 [Spirochaetales bacterium]MCF7937803.1 50S ribosomal protein L30 [Spirochaetales bacterium]
MKKVRIILKRSTIGSKPKHRRTIEALGLKKVNSQVEQEANPAIMGMIESVLHLVEVEEL